MIFGFNSSGKFVRLNKPILPGNDIEWVHIFNQLDLQDSLGRVPVNAHPAAQFVPQARDVFLAQAVRQDAIAIPAPERAQHAAGSVIRGRLLVESKTAQGRRKNRGNCTSTRRDPEAGGTSIIGFLSELNSNSADRTRIEHMNDRADDSSPFTTEFGADAMLPSGSSSGLEFLFNEL